jgi:hypothetical protein
LVRFYDTPGSLTPSMKNINIELKKGHIFLKMEFDPEESEKNKVAYTTEAEFVEEMLELLNRVVYYYSDLQN